MFPFINSVEDLKVILDENFIHRVTIGTEAETKVSSIFYMVQNETAFSGEHADLKREARGISFGPYGEIMSRPFHKFFNVGEKPETMPDVIPWDRVKRIMVKRDGSMVHPIRVDDQAFLKTKKTASSKEAQAATELLNKSENQRLWVLSMMFSGFTPIFEFTSPNFPIVVSYTEPVLTLLAIRNNRTGEYLDIYSLNYCPFAKVEDIKQQFMENGAVSFQKIKDWCMNATQIEGVVIQLDDGQMFKAKTKWYNELHRTIVFIRVRDVVAAVLSDNVDDMIGAFRMCGRPEATIQQVISIRDQVLTEIGAIKQHCREVVDSIPSDLERRKVYEEYAKKSQYPNQVMFLYDGKDVDWMEFYRKNKLKDWSLDVICDTTGD